VGEENQVSGLRPLSARPSSTISSKRTVLVFSAVRDLRTLIDDTEVTLAFYGSIVYLAVVSTLASQRELPRPAVAISAVVTAATVLYIAHVFAALVPRVARAGRMPRAELGAALRHDLPLLITAIVPAIPLLVAAWRAVPVDTGYRLSVRITIGMLFALAVTLSRRDGLGWARAIASGVVILVLTIVVIWLESQVH
jgi:hypothetical protein